MPFCTQCGKEVEANQQFCGACGTPSPAEPAAPVPSPASPVAPGPSPIPPAAPGPAGVPPAVPTQYAAPASAVPPAEPTALAGHQLVGQTVGIVAAIMLAVGPFLAWLSAGFVSATGLDKTDNEALVLVALGVVGIVIGAISLISKRSVLPIVPLIMGVIALGMSLYYLFALRDDQYALGNIYFEVTIGPGIYMCLIASALVIVGAIMSGLKVRKS